MIGALNFNNMIPVSNDVIQKLDIRPSSSDTPKEREYKELLNNQLDWCNDNIDNIIKKANKLYRLITQSPENQSTSHAVAVISKSLRLFSKDVWLKCSQTSTSRKKKLLRQVQKFQLDIQPLYADAKYRQIPLGAACSLFIEKLDQNFETCVVIEEKLFAIKLFNGFVQIDMGKQQLRR